MTALSPDPQPSTSAHAVAARRALRQFLAARRANDDAVAAVYLAALRRHLDDHVVAFRRAQRERLS